MWITIVSLQYLISVSINCTAPIIHVTYPKKKMIYLVLEQYCFYIFYFFQTLELVLSISAVKRL